ncbi:MAG: Uma2 family endonuclease, partial [Dolichospermum sp.]
DNLEAFLQQPNIESSPAWEFIQGKAQQKPMPTLFHSRLQRNLVNQINNRTQSYEAIQELRYVIANTSYQKVRKRCCKQFADILG